MKLQKTIQIYEYLIAFYLALQIIKPEQINFLPTIGGFISLLVMKYIYEGFRLNTIFLILFQLIILATSSSLAHFMAVCFAFVIIVYFPVYNYPAPSGKHLVGYRRFIENHQRVAIFYPTDEKKKDVRYYPHEDHWVRFYEIMKLSEIVSRGKRKYRIPKILHKIVLTGLERRKLGVNYKANIIDNPSGFPVIIFSHGLSANRHAYTVLMKEWASYGFIVMSLEHDENVLIRPKDNTEALEIRTGQLHHRALYVKDLLSIVYEQKRMQQILEKSDLKINYKQIFLSGHSFGGATAVETATYDKRVTGGLVLLDPWLEPCDQSVYKASLNIPIISLRSQTFEGIAVLKELDLKLAKANSDNSDKLISGYFKSSTHHSVTDMVLALPKELFIFGMLGDLQEIEDQLQYHTALTRIFLQTVIENPNNIKQTTLERYQKYLTEMKKSNVLILDEF